MVNVIKVIPVVALKNRANIAYGSQIFQKKELRVFAIFVHINDYVFKGLWFTVALAHFFRVCLPGEVSLF